MYHTLNLPTIRVAMNKSKFLQSENYTWWYWNWIISLEL